MARPEDVHVLTLIERLFVHNILKNKKIQEQIILKKKKLLLLSCQHQSMLWLLAKSGQRQECGLSNSEHNSLLESYFRNQRSQYCPKKKVSYNLCPIFMP